MGDFNLAQQIAVGFFTTTLPLGIAGWMAQKLLLQRFSKELQEHKSQLDRELQEHRHALELQTESARSQIARVTANIQIGTQETHRAYRWATSAAHALTINMFIYSILWCAHSSLLHAPIPSEQEPPNDGFSFSILRLQDGSAPCAYVWWTRNFDPIFQKLRLDDAPKSRPWRTRRGQSCLVRIAPGAGQGLLGSDEYPQG